MKIKFNIYNLRKDAEETKDIKHDMDLIVVGKENIGDDGYYRVHPITKEGLKLINGLDIQQSAFYMPKSDIVFNLEESFMYSYEFDIEEEYLNDKILADIKTLN